MFGERRWNVSGAARLRVQRGSGRHIIHDTCRERVVTSLRLVSVFMLLYFHTRRSTSQLQHCSYMQPLHVSSDLFLVSLKRIHLNTNLHFVHSLLQIIRWRTWVREQCSRDSFQSFPLLCLLPPDPDRASISSLVWSDINPVRNSLVLLRALLFAPLSSNGSPAAKWNLFSKVFNSCVISRLCSFSFLLLLPSRFDLFLHSLSLITTGAKRLQVLR